MLAGVKATQGGGEGPFVELTVKDTYFTVVSNLSPAEARQLAARLYIAARAAERITRKELQEEGA